jgi:hypothetical protein
MDRDAFVVDLLTRIFKPFEKRQSETEEWWQKLGEDADQQ